MLGQLYNCSARLCFRRSAELDSYNDAPLYCKIVYDTHCCNIQIILQATSQQAKRKRGACLGEGAELVS